MTHRAPPYRGRTLMALFAHPDDESLAAGGLLAMAARGGARVVVVSATRGEAGPQLGGAAGELAEARAAELADACRVLGAEPPRFLGWPDGGVGDLDPARRAGEVHRVLAEIGPDVAVTYGEDGWYGHRDHTACTRALHDAVTRAGRIVRLLYTQFPRGLGLPIRRLLAGTASLDPAVGEDDLGIERARAELVLDIAAVAEVKRRAIACHVSQLPGGDVDRFLDGVVGSLLATEWYTVASGPPLGGAGDPFAGL